MARLELTRRTLVRSLIGCATARSFAQSARAGSVRVQIHPEIRLGAIPKDFIGLGYEISSVSQRGLLASSNSSYVQFVRTLGPNGIIRIGGNTSDYASWSPDGPAVSSPQGTVVDQPALDDLASFLRATGWRLIWGLNLGSGTVEQAVDEAVAVASSAGDRLLAFEIGNEPDLFAGVHRPTTYSYADYESEYRGYKNAIRAKLPDAPFAGPDVLFQTNWFEQFAAAEASDAQLLTHHYYAEGPPDNPASTIENLLKPNAALSGLMGTLQAASGKSQRPYRICEANSCFGGGKPGVSNTMAASLWGLDFLFTLAQFDAAGVNIETGVNQLGFLSWYSPIGVASTSAYRAMPMFYGMLAFSLAGRGSRVQLTLNNAGLNVTAYAVRSARSEISLTLVNKEPARHAQVRANCPGFGTASVLRLTASSISSVDDIRLGGSEVGADGNWTPGALEQVRVIDGEIEIAVPAASAATVWFR